MKHNKEITQLLMTTTPENQRQEIVKAGIAAAIWITCSPVEWKWSQKEQEAMARALCLLSTERDTLLREHGEMRKALEEYASIQSESAGVAGWHKNGDVAEWDEFEFMSVLSSIPDRSLPLTL